MGSFSRTTQGAAAGASLGSSAGPIGAGIGAVAGGLGGLLGGGEKRKQLPNLSDFYSPFGRVTTGPKGIYFTPNIDETTQGILDTSNQRIRSLATSLPSEVNPYNNSLYQNTLSNLQGQVQRQKQRDLNDLNNNLNARNQIGSSYDALTRNQFNERYDNLNRQAENTAFDNYSSSLQNTLASLVALQNQRDNVLNNIYEPLRYASQYIAY